MDLDEQLHIDEEKTPARQHVDVEQYSQNKKTNKTGHSNYV